MRNAMKIAIPVWNDCVSNVFDFAHRLLLVEIENGKEISRSEVELKAESLPQRVGKLKSLKVDVLICGAISRALAYMVTASGMEVLAFVTGRIDDVLGAYLTGQLAKPQFSMPGYWPGARKGFGRGRRMCRWRGSRR
jgi:predicted Fe-Mo cluster-binding NifX family protein